MISRRAFLGASAATVVGPATRSDIARGDVPQGGEDLPPSILALTSMKDRATPITAEERTARMEKARRLMARHGLDAIMLAGGTSMAYFTNVRWWLSERLFSVIIPANGQPFVVTPAFEEGRTREQLDGGPLRAAETDVFTWHEDEDPYRLVGDGLAARGIATGTLGIEETVWFAYSNGVAQRAPAVTLTSATPVTAGCRGVKTAHEIELMRLASDVTLKAYEAAYRALEDGMTQDRFGQLVRAAHDRLGFSGSAGRIIRGTYSTIGAMPQPSPM